MKKPVNTNSFQTMNKLLLLLPITITIIILLLLLLFFYSIIEAHRSVNNASNKEKRKEKIEIIN